MRTHSAMLQMAILVALSGCALRPQLVKHHDSWDDTDDKNLSLNVVGGNVSSVGNVGKVANPDATAAFDLLQGGAYTVSGFVSAPPQSASSAPFVTRLSERGQAELISQVAAGSQKTSEWAGALMKFGDKSPKACTDSNTVRFERRLIISLAGRHAYPAARFDAAAYVLKLKDDRVKFVSWNRFDTLHESVALGTTRLKQSQAFGLTDFDSDKKTVAATAAAPAKELLSTLNLTASQSRELEESVASTRRFTPVTGTLSNEHAAIVQQGAVGLDIFGNLTADFTMEGLIGSGAKPHVKRESIYAFSGLFKADGTAQADTPQISVSRCERSYMASASPVTASLTSAVVVRRVETGSDTAIEGDDKAVFSRVNGSGAAEIELVDSASLRHVYFIITSPHRVNLRNISGGGDMRFASLDEAANLVKWLRQSGKTKLPDLDLGWFGIGGTLANTPLAKSDARVLYVQRCEVQNDGTNQCASTWN